MIEQIDEVTVSDSSLDYLQDIVEKSRTLSWGLSPRGARDFNKLESSTLDELATRSPLDGRQFRGIAWQLCHHRITEAPAEINPPDHLLDCRIQGEGEPTNWAMGRFWRKGLASPLLGIFEARMWRWAGRARLWPRFFILPARNGRVWKRQWHF